LFYMAIVASAPFQSFAHVANSTADSSNEQHRVCTKLSVFSCWSWTEDGAVCQEHVKFFGETLKKLRTNFEGTLKETSKFFGETLFNFFRSSDFLRSILLIGEFQIFVVEYSNIWTYSNYSNFPTAPMQRFSVQNVPRKWAFSNTKTFNRTRQPNRKFGGSC
jgi:hypothetical protein